MNEEPSDLDEYLARRMEENPDQELDVFTQLAQKEKDLTLAAELGKALLEKNEELERVNAQLHDEYQTKLEQLEQEKYDSRYRLENAEQHYDMLVKELSSDVALYRQEVESKEAAMKQEERERYQVVAELTKQNERLSDRLRQAEELSEELAGENQSLREQLRSRQTTTLSNEAEHELMREEMVRLTEELGATERRMRELTEEKDAVSVGMEERQERITMLEKQKHQKEVEIRSKDHQIMELKDSNVLLEERLEDVYLQVSSGEFSHNNSLFSELEMSSDNLDQLGRSNESRADEEEEESVSFDEEMDLI